MMKLKKNDEVVVMTGKDRTKRGKILRVLPKEYRLVVEGVNVRKVRERARKAGAKGQVIERPSPVAISNVLLYCAACKKGVRVGSKLLKTKKVRICKQCEKEI
ncbi:MAG: 50S ribosomal protein L24 [Patescibacteria group bacterium]